MTGKKIDKIKLSYLEVNQKHMKGKKRHKISQLSSLVVIV